jgi:hypothetical protein
LKNIAVIPLIDLSEKTEPALLDDFAWARRYLSTSLAFVDDRSAANFDALADVVRDMPGDPSLTGRWPYTTWFPFVAAPKHHIAIRPAYIEEFASASAFDIAYKSELDFVMYERVCMLAECLLKELDSCGLNTGRRSLDMIDAQSFMWVARRYSEPGFEGAST